MVVLRLGGSVVGWMCDKCGGPRCSEVPINCSSVSSWCACTNWFCRLGWRSAINLGGVK